MFPTPLHRWIPVHLLFISICTCIGTEPTPGQSPGCHRLTYIQDIQKEGCVIFRVRTNACRGYCKSFAYPSSFLTLLRNPRQKITSRAECCSIATTKDVYVSVRCVHGDEVFTFKSAETCACSVCRTT